MLAELFTCKHPINLIYLFPFYCLAVLFKLALLKLVPGPAIQLMLILALQGINAIYPVYKEGILNGSPELKEQSAKLLGEVVSLTTPEALKPALNNVTGPLIRIFGDRFSLNVKVAILDTLSLLLSKVALSFF